MAVAWFGEGCVSWPAVGWALGQQAPSSASKFLLVMLADAASIGDWLSWPSVAYLSEATQQDRKTVLSNLRKLQLASLIAPQGKTGRTGQIVIWKLPVVALDRAPKKPKTGTLSTEQTVPNFPANSTGFPVEQYQKRDTEPVIEPVIEPEGERGKRADAAVVGSRLPTDWALPDELRHYCATHRPDLSPDGVAEGFRDYWVAVPGAKGLKADWPATWRRWVREQRATTAGARRSPLHADNVFGSSP